ncbi:DUF5994 family protein [Nonomuraea roseoviolacea subsp. roseoviolacea]|uniref:Uncharacterized protein n=1 Tax=Nonomuraea roseoviolacea subsp. carminata TaxID=160689 RepID=A0ABT1K9I0_9ACTN|nr:DUF5994 family protein [Nonomuraea roseoviolacea]MCP2350684.1 hypothetical protein [Nonomuraea roseoviolacea subsp. carminata]
MMTAILSPQPGAATADVPTAHPELRLRLNPALDRKGTVDGAWWPRTRDAAAELPALIAAVGERSGRNVLRVGVHRDAWDHIPHRIPTPGRQVRVGWFRSADPSLVTLSLAGTEPVTLLVVPPGTAEETATAALTLAAAGTVGVSPGDILHPAAPEGGSGGPEGHADRDSS